VSRRNRKDVPVRTYGGDKLFRVSRKEADRMLADRQVFVLADSPLELQLLRPPHWRPKPLGPDRPDLSLLMSPSVIMSAASGAKASIELVKGWDDGRENKS
jgi:hypothetical protein